MYFHIFENQNVLVPNALLLMNEKEAIQILENNDREEPQASESYEILDASGSLTNGSYIISNKIPVSTDGRDIFEERFMARGHYIENEPGFCALRILRSINTQNYMIFVLWENETSYKNWTISEAYKKTHKKRGTKDGIDIQHPELFIGPSEKSSYVVNN